MHLSCCSGQAGQSLEKEEAADGENEEPMHQEEKDEDEKLVQQSGQTEPFPELKVERTLWGLVQAANKGREIFDKGLDLMKAGDHSAAKEAIEESIKWDSQYLWVARMEEVSGPELIGDPNHKFWTPSGAGFRIKPEKRSLIHCNRAIALEKLERWQEAEADCSEALKLNSENSKARGHRARVRCRLGKPESAQRDVDKALKDRPRGDWPEHYVEIQREIDALRVEHVQERTEAGEPWPELAVEPGGLSGLEKAEQARSEASTAMWEGTRGAWNVGGHWAASHSYRVAAQWLDKAIWFAGTGQVEGVTCEQRSALHYDRAVAYCHTGSWQEVEEDCSEALALDGQNVRAQYRRAMARYRLADSTGGSAEERWRKAEAALQDIEQVLKVLLEGSGSIRSDIEEFSDRERFGTPREFKKNIEALCKKQEAASRG